MALEGAMDGALARERVANRPKHWVRAVTACNSRCVFCLDSDTPRNLYLPVDEVKAELDRGREELGATKVIISGGEASLHPAFPELVRYARDTGYERVQTVTNGWRFADRPFFEEVMDAGLGEITFSLHGHTEALHDRLTRHPGSFRRLVKGLVRALRDGRPIVNVDVVINKQNVAVLDRIVELAISLGVTEFDLLHVIPQASAFDHRDELFYDPREHLPVLHKVFRLNEHPGFVIWTNRFPVSYLEGMEELIQDPHKMLDEINGRRHMVRAYLDTGKPLDCRDPERCRHCFIEPTCTTVDRVIADQRAGRWEVWWVGAEGWRGEPLPYGCSLLGVEVAALAELAAAPRPEGAGLYARVGDAAALSALDGLSGVPVVLEARTAAQLEAWLADDDVAPGVAVDVVLGRDTAPWLAANRARLAASHRALRLVQPGRETLAEARAHDVRDPGAFLRELGLRLPVAGLPACLAPGAELAEPRRVLPRRLFDPETGRLVIRELARFHVTERYHGRSVRCDDCAVSARCDGIPIAMVRDQGLALARPLVAGEAWADDAARQLEARWPEPPGRLATGRPPEPPAPSLPGHAPPSEAPPPDPLAVAARRVELARLARRARRRAPDGPPSQGPP